MKPWTKRGREKKARLDAIEAELAETDSLLVVQQPKVNALVSWLEVRKAQNGFGDDFEWTLAYPRQRGKKP